MAQQKRGLITRLLEGKEKSEEYARSTLPTNRWQLFWDIFKGNFWKIVKVNLLTLIFFIPVIVVIFLGGVYKDGMGVTYPFAGSLGIGYPANPDTKGLAQMLTLQSDFILYFGIIIAAFIAAVGLAGGMYVVRNMVWTEGIFVTNDFWRGVKLNYKNAMQTALFFCVLLFFCQSAINLSEFTMVAGEVGKVQKIMLVISQITSYIFLALALMMSFWMIALGVNYKMSFGVMLRNSFLMTIGTLPQTVFFILMAFIPLLLFLIGWSFTTILAVMMVLLFGLGYALLVWLDFAQWVFDKYINPKIEGAKVGRGVFNKDGTSALTGDDSAASIEYQRTLLSHGRSRLVAKPIKPIDDSLQVYDLPASFTREDLKRLRESKQNIAEDTEAYAEEHRNDLRYVEYNRQFDEREKALQEEDAKKGAKRGKKLKAIAPPKQDGEE